MNSSTTTRRPQSSPMILKLLPYLWSTDWHLRVRALISLALVIATIALNLSIPLVFKKIISVLSGVNVSTVYSAQLLLLAYGLLWIISQVTLYSREIVLFRVMGAGIRKLSYNVFSHFHVLSLRFHLERRTGAITSAIEKAQDGFSDIFSGIFLFVIPTIVEVLITVGILWQLYDISYSAVLLGILISYVVFSIIGMEWSSKAQKISNEKEANANARVVDSLLNFETVKYFGNQKFEQEQFDHTLKEAEDATTVKRVRYELVHLGQGILIGIGLTILTWMTGTRVISGALNVSDFVLVNGYLLQFVTPLSHFGFILRETRKGLINLENVMNLMEIQPEIKDAPDAQKLKLSSAEITFDNVKFGYDPRRLILKGVSFTVPAGHTFAIVGPTGAGKSTISRLVFRFYDVNDGAIRIDGQDIRSVTQESLHAAIGIVPQETVLFNNTLYYNIAYARPSASKQEVEHVIALANLSQFVNALPDGYNTMVGERGLKLSGGEKQRIGIARTLLKNPKIYIFDEATSALDTYTEKEIQQNLEEISAHATTLVIAHRLSTVVHADMILVLVNGQIVEQGTHAQLMKHHGIYMQLWEQQARSIPEIEPEEDEAEEELIATEDIIGKEEE